MIQLRRIRMHTPKGSEPISTERPTEPPVEVSSVQKLFEKYDEILETIPQGERWNIYYTLGHTDGDYRRNWHGQDVIPFDIDGVVDDAGNFDEQRYLDVIFGALGVEREKCVIVASGNGIQILLQPLHPITDKGFFRKQRDAYERICGEVAAALTAAGLRFKEVDPSSFAMNRIFRFPGTENRKPDKPVRWARLISRRLEPQPFAISPAPPDVAGKPADPLAVSDKQQLTEKQLSFFAIDTPAVEAGCSFLKWARENPADLSEPQWYGLLSIVGRLDDGRQRVHKYSEGHPRYSERDCDRKLDQALAASGPRTCDNIDQLWGQCQGCPHFKRITSPVSIKSETFIATEHSGFYLLGKSGALQPQFEDLRRFLQREAPYKTEAKSGTVYQWEGTKYQVVKENELRGFAHEHFNPKPADHVAREFTQWVNRTNFVSIDWFRETTRGHIAFRNGVLCLATGELSEHSPERGFLSCLPYDFDPKATCPTFDQFMRNITLGDKQLEALLLEFIGYALVDQDYWLQKALVLVGEGSNGKSTFLQVVEQLAGTANTAFLSLAELQSETSRSQLEGKLLNLCDELPNYSLKSTELLKKLFGGTTTVRRLYHDGIVLKNNAKFIFAGNAIPDTTDTSAGFFRRLEIVPFEARFSVGPEDGAQAADTTLAVKMTAELPGIFNCVVAHYKRLKERGHLIVADKAKAEHARYRETTDRTGTWIKENLYWNGSGVYTEKDPFLAIRAIYDLYISECKKDEEKPLTKNNWTKHLRRHIDFFEARYTKRRIDGAPTHILRGVEFRHRKADF